MSSRLARIPLISYIAVAVATAAQGQTVVYDNSTNYLGTEHPIFVQLGNEITLAGTDRIITSIKVAVRPIEDVRAAITARVTFTMNDGGFGDSPGTFLWSSDFLSFSIDGGAPTFIEFDAPNVRVPDSAILLEEGRGLECAQHFVHENRIRQAASGVGVSQYCINEAVAYANDRVTWGQPLSRNQAIQFPLAELHTEVEMVRNLVYKTAWHLDREDHMAVTAQVSMANYRANRLACNAADLAMQVHGGIGYTRAKPFEHIYRHHRRYRITEGSEEIQIRKVAAQLFGFSSRKR